MIRHLYTICFLLLFVVAGSFSSVQGQETKELTPKKGLAHIKAEDYKNAELVYAHLLKKYPKDGAYNFYMGICLLYNRGDLSQSLKMLNYARVKKVSRKVFFYLGRAHQLSFHFEEAISNFNNFLKYASIGDSKIAKAKYYLQQCDDSRKIAAKIYDLDVIDKAPILKDRILDLYQPGSDVGQFYKNGDFFESGVNPNNVMFETERGDVIYFSMETSSEDTMSIYKMEKLMDGWGESKTLGTPVNSIYNDAYPFLGSDGLTFYFSSDRPGGFGGFDIYKIYYDNESQSFLDPINMGIPFNSPDDDYLFVSDEFNEMAWFTSNRETSGDTVMVYSVKWDGTQVRNMAEDANQVAESAKLNVGSVAGTKRNTKQATGDTANRQKKKSNGSISFEINDSIVYTDFSHFLSTEALALYKDGYNKKNQKDSLAFLMRSKRVKYASIINEEDRNQVVNEILTLENRVYSLEDDIQEKFLYARQKELNEIRNKVKQGVYKPSNDVEVNNPKALNFDGVFIPSKYSLHTSDEFERHFSQQKEMYSQLFSANDIDALRYADSLYVWANILNLESSRLMEESTKEVETENLNIGQLIKKVDDLKNKEKEEEVPTSNMMKESKELKMLSTRIYHKALDKKFPIYYLKLKDKSRNLNESNSKNILLLSQQGNAYYREAKNILNEPGGLNIESFEKAGTLKKAGIAKQEKALKIYCGLEKESTIENNNSQNNIAKGVVQKSYAEIHRGEDIKETTEEVVEEAQKSIETVKPTKDVQKGIFKIQIGVFKNAPKQEALAKIPEVSKFEIEGRGLTKYFAGNFTTYEEAQKSIPVVINAGFVGAFVVYLEDGHISAIPKK